MNASQRLLIALPLCLLLGACSNLTQREYERCIVGVTALGGVVGGGVSGGSDGGCAGGVDRTDRRGRYRTYSPRNLS